MARKANGCAGRPRKGGRVVRQERNGQIKVVRTEGERWSDETEEAFLAELASTCNVTAAAAAVDFSTTAIYRRRQRDAGFAAAWDAAVAVGYVRLEAMLLAKATGDLAGEPPAGDDAAAARMSVDQALNLLKLHRAEVRGGPPQRYAARARPPDMEEVRASILRKIEAIERAAARARPSASPS